MNEFYFLKELNQELMYAVKDITEYSNVFIKEIHIVQGKTTFKYEILSKDGFKQEEKFTLNNLK